MQLVKKEKCYTCEACIQICPRQAIHVENLNGYNYPHIDTKSCIDCGLCRKVCPSTNDILDRNGYNPHLYSFVHSNKTILDGSSSGGAFSALAEIVLNRHGWVVGAVLCEDNSVSHIISNSIDGCIKMRGSKYVQSKIGNIYDQVIECLSRGEQVLYVGIPCQVNAMRKYCIIKQANIDLIVFCTLVCHGSASAKIWKDYWEFFLQDKPKDTYIINFRDDTSGWKNSSITAKGENTKYDLDGYSSLYFSNFCVRESCFQCKYSTVNRFSDITIGDFWNIKEYDKSIDDNYGISMILTHSELGEEIVRGLSNYGRLRSYCFDVNKDYLQKALLYPPDKPLEYDLFWKDYNKNGIQYVLKKYAGMTLYQRVLRKIRKSFLRRKINKLKQ